MFDISQTNGRELPELANRLTGEVKDYDVIFAALKEIAPYPISFEPIEGGANGYCSHAAQKIVIREGVSQEQAVKTAIHEIAHGIMHTPDKERDSVMFEVQAESVAYIVCQHLGVDSSQYSFGYVAGWASDKELKVLQNSLADIQAAADELIQSLEPEIQHQRELAKAKALEEPEMLPTEMLLQKSTPVPPAAELSMSNDALAKQMAQNGFKQMESKGQLSDFLVFRDKEINDFLTFYDWNMVAKFASEHRAVTADSRDIRVEGLTGSWRAIDSIEIYGREYFMLQHEQHGSAYPNVIVDNKGYAMTGLTLNGWQELRDNMESLETLYDKETHDPESMDYRDSRSPGEQRLVQLWDEGCAKGNQRMCEDILKAESERKKAEPQKSSLIKAGELTKGAQLADRDGFLFDVAEVVKQTDKTITVRLCSDFSSFKEHWTVKPGGETGGIIKTFNKESRLYGIKAPEPTKRNISDRLVDAKKECDRINAGRQAPERNNRNIDMTR